MIKSEIKLLITILVVLGFSLFLKTINPAIKDNSYNKTFNVNQTGMIVLDSQK